jgi:hypothetical protein
MLRRLLFAAMFVALPLSAAFAQCNRIGEQVCQGGFLYSCAACVSEECLIFTGEQCRAPVDSLAGTWSGSGHQSGGGFSSSDYPVVMTIDQSGGSVDYPSLKCGGPLVDFQQRNRRRVSRVGPTANASTAA